MFSMSSSWIVIGCFISRGLVKRPRWPPDEKMYTRALNMPPQIRNFFLTPLTPLKIPIKLHTFLEKIWPCQTSTPRKFQSLLWGKAQIFSGTALFLKYGVLDHWKFLFYYLFILGWNFRQGQHFSVLNTCSDRKFCQQQLQLEWI